MLLSLVADSLEQSAGLRVARATTWRQASALLTEHAPGVLIFDLTAANESRVLPLLLTWPGLSLVGLDAERNRAVLVSGQETQALTLDRIREIAITSAGRRLHLAGD